MVVLGVVAAGVLPVVMAAGTVGPAVLSSVAFSWAVCGVGSGFPVVGPKVLNAEGSSWALLVVASASCGGGCVVAIVAVPVGPVGLEGSVPFWPSWFASEVLAARAGVGSSELLLADWFLF